MVGIKVEFGVRTQYHIRPTRRAASEGFANPSEILGTRTSKPPSIPEDSHGLSNSTLKFSAPTFELSTFQAPPLGQTPFPLPVPSQKCHPANLPTTT